MVRSAIADDNFLKYLHFFAKQDFPTAGLILGQPTESKDYIIHLTRTPPYSVDGENVPKKFAELSDTWIGDHARHVTRMLPGGMYVLGIFIVSQEDLFNGYTPKIKTILSQINKKLKINEFLYGIPKDGNQLILNYSPSSRSYVFKNYNYDTGSISLSEIRFQSNFSLKWLQVECKYELDQIFPIVTEKANWPLKLHINDILQLISTNLKLGIFFFDGEVKDQDESLESIGKKRLKSGHHENGDVKLMHVTIVLPMGINSTSEVEIVNCGGQIRLAGHVTSKVWLHPKATVKDASTAIIQDITRSLAARLEMHCDSLIEEEQSSVEDTNSIHETPRRVMVNLPNSKVTLSDYLFPGEGSQEAQISLGELLDIKISEPNVIFDVEGQADLSNMCNEGMDVDNDDILEKLPNATNKNIYIAGLGIAFIVLVISLLIHFIKNWQ